MADGIGNRTLSRWSVPVLALSLLLGLWSADASAQGVEREGTAGYGQDGAAVGTRGVFTTAFKDDLTPLIRRGVVRVLVSYNRTSFTITEGAAIAGFEYELMMQYRRYLKTRVKKRSWPVQFVFIPMAFDDLLPALLEGRGDIVAAGITVTPEREKLVAFTRPYIRNVKEVVVAAPSVEGLNTLDDLAGREIFIRPETSYAESLAALNADLAARGLKKARLDPASGQLAKEDIFELIDADAVSLTIADSHLASLWSKFYGNMVVRDDLVLREGGTIAWAVRKENPELLKSLNTFIKKSGQGTLIGNMLLKRYFVDPAWFTRPLDHETRTRLDELAELLQRNADKYGFDWRLLAALAFQESRLDHSVVSPVGAVGLMQVMPSTAEAPPIELMPIQDLEKNVEAGAKYLAFVRDEYFNEPGISDLARVDFALASYNAGPSRINRMRRLAKKKGLNPDVWFGNVEKVVRRNVGLEPVQYVGNINRYYIEFVLLQKAEEERRQGLEKAKQ